MKKMTKLLSVILAFVMALSCMSVMSSALTTNYKTVAGLEGMNAYSPYGTVSRLTTEERLDIAFDSLDGLLAKLNINMGTIDIKVGKLVLDLTSVDNLCKTISSIKDNQGLLNTAGNLSFLGIDIGMLKELTTSTWPSTQPTRAANGNLVVAAELLEFLDANQSLVESIFVNGINLGKTISGFVKGLDLSGINGLVMDIPGTVNGIVFPMMGRQDDDATQRGILSNKKSNLIGVAQSFVNGLFTKPMNWTSYRVDASGKDLGYTSALPTQESGTSRYFVVSADKKTIEQWDYAYNGLLDTNGGRWKQTVIYTLSDKEEYEGSGTYLYKAPEGYDGDQTLKWYKADGKADANGRIQSAYWLPSIQKLVADGTLTLEINGSDSLLGLLYKFIPYVFAEMAPTVLNGSAKKLIAEAFDVEFTKIGELKATNASNKVFAPDAGLQAVIAETGNPDNFFTKAQDYYVWEYSDYKVINGTPYYRFQNTYFKGELPTNISVFYNMFNWDWEVKGDFMNEFIPTTVGETWALDGLNNIVKKAIDTMIADTWTVKGVTYTRAEAFPWEAGDNSKLLNNLMICARKFFNYAPEEVVDEFVSEAQFYEPMMNGTMKQAVNGLVCELVKLIMPQVKFPNNIVDQPITAIAAIVVRELCTQLMPSYNFDAMIYADYNDRAVLSGKSADYWLDTTLYMGVNLGMYYIRNLADIGEDSDDYGYYGVMKTLGALPSNGTADAMTFTATSQYVGGKVDSKNASWLYQVDWIVDWALSNEVEWAWNFDFLVNCGDVVEMRTYQNPLKKLDTIICGLLPFDQLINISKVDSEECVYGSNTFLEKVLKNGLVNSIVNLDVDKLQSLFEIPEGYFRSGNIADSAVKIIVNLLDKILNKVSGVDIIDKSKVTSVNTLLNQTNIKTIVGNLVGHLYDAYEKKLLVTVLPMINMFIGWTTDPQKYAEPSVVVDTNGVGYITIDATSGSGTATLKVRNSASGMLLKHRASNVYNGSDWSAVEDKPYFLSVTSIESTDPNMTFSKTGITDLNPGESDEITITTTSDKAASMITVTYELKRKDGEVLGNSQKTQTYIYATTTQSDIYQTADKQEDIKGTTSAIDCVIFDFGLSTKNLLVTSPSNMASTIEDLSVTITNKRDTACKITYVTYEGFDANLIAKNEAALAPYQNDQTTIAKSGDPGSSLNVRVATINPSFDLDTLASGQTFALGKAKAQLYGEYKRPIIGTTVKTHGTSNDLYFGTLFYVNMGDFNKLYNDEIGKNRVAENYTAESWATYQTALFNATAYYYEPITVATFPNYTDESIAAQKNALQAAIDGLVEKGKASELTAASVEAAYNAAEGNDGVNFQNVQLFEYFKYEKARNNATAMINAYKQPQEPTPYIEKESISYDLISAIVASKTGTVKDGINATILPADDEAMKNYNDAKNDWKAPNYTSTEIADTAERITYYRQFLIPKAADKTFLNKEIAYAEAQGYVASAYSADSWSRYTVALAEAKAVAANAAAKESEVFDAKYELMLAQNKLQLKERSMKEVGYMNEELIPLIQAANAIIDNYGSLYTVKSGVTYTDAFAQLVRALGVKYDVTIDGKEYEGILYTRSALCFQEYDRTASAKNKKAVDFAADKLREAIENFECTAKLEAATGTQVEVEQAIRYIKNVHPNSVPTEAALLAKVNITGATGAAPVVTASKSGNYGTGARIDVVKNDILLASYFVVIDGDVNGDGAVDAFDALEVDVANHTAYYMGDVYDDAADLNSDGIVNASDYSSLAALVMCTNA